MPRLHLKSGVARLVLLYLGSGGEVRQRGIAELLKGRFHFVCPWCFEKRALHMSLSQIEVSQSAHGFVVDTKAGGVAKIIDPWGHTVKVPIVGTVTVEKSVTCPREGCGYTVRIEDSRVREVQCENAA